MKQTTLAFSCASGLLPAISAGHMPPPPPPKSRSHDDKYTARPPTKRTKTATELSCVTRDQAAATIARLRAGYRDKSGAGYPAAVTNEAGCVLVRKTPNREENGYVQIAPVISHRRRVKKGEARRPKPAPQNAHRLVVLASKSEIDHLLAGEQASHLCHQPTCINPEHIVVEPKAANEGRKACRALGPIFKTVWQGKELTLPPQGVCNCSGRKCIFMIERREAFAE